MEGSNWWAVGKVRVLRLLDSMHRRIRALVQAEGGHMPYYRRYCYIVLLVNCTRINPHVDIPIWSYTYAGNKNGTFCLLFPFIQFYIIYENITHAK